MVTSAAPAAASGHPELPVSLDAVRLARKTLAGIARTTAVEGSRHLSSLVGSPVHLKCENLQRTPDRSSCAAPMCGSRG